MANESIGLAEAIEQVRSELACAQREVMSEGSKSDLRFRIGQVDLQISGPTEPRRRSRNGCQAVGHLRAGATGSSGRVSTHTISVTMTPVMKTKDGDWEDVLVADQMLGRPPASPPPD